MTVPPTPCRARSRALPRVLAAALAACAIVCPTAWPIAWPGLAGVCEAKTAISLEGPMLVLDSPNEAKLPRNFRATGDAVRKAAANGPSLDGLAELHASASGQFSEAELRFMLARLPKDTVLVDLRQESHGFVSSVAVSWYGERNRANAGKTQAEIAEDEKNRLREVEAGANVGVGILKWGEKERETAPESIVVPVKKVFSEAELAPFYGLGYRRIPAPDALGPRDEDVDAFLELARSLPRGAWAHFHDNSGLGRATTYLVMYDIWRNAQAASLEDIVKRQLLLGGTDLASEGHAGRRVQEFKDREAFFRRFYEFSKESHGDRQPSWAGFTAKHSGK
ncbi:MAG: hypothetical protein HQK81_13445 [Desulfovibrionaceae bacterium]|nr:hypothetical protein [Desulfovibrionaceae bacterium]MBF0515047.1 hypothetical protein [Desulfovibrionaceae bacterium]